MGLIFGLSSVPDLRVAPEPAVDFVLRKLAHAAVYAILAVLLRLPLAGSPRGDVTALVATIAYAASDELHQAFVPGRGPSVVDVGIDSVGGLAGILALGRARQHSG